MSPRIIRSPRQVLLLAPVLAFSLLILGIVSASPAAAAPAPVGLGTAASFAVLAGSTVTNTGPTVVSGDLGVHPGSSVTGFPPGQVINGTIHIANAVAAQAKDDLVTAYNDAAGRSTDTTVTADLGGQTLVPGVYTGSTLSLTGTLTLDAQGDANAVWIFQSASTLITATGSRVVLANGANACNVFWQIGSSATLGVNSTMVGTIMALTSITANTGARVTGRLLSRNGATTLDDNQITNSCAAAAPSASPSASASTTASGSPSASASASASTTTSSSATPTPSASATPTASGSATATATTEPSAEPTVEPTETFTEEPDPEFTPVSGPGVDAPPEVQSGGSGRPPSLPTTGAPIMSMLLAGAFALMLGALVLRSPQTYVGAHRCRCGGQAHA